MINQIVKIWFLLSIYSSLSSENPSIFSNKGNVNLEEEAVSPFTREKPLPQIVQDAGENVEKLGAAIRYPDFEVREAAAWVLGQIGEFNCIAPLVNALKDPDSIVREAAAMALGKIKELPNIHRRLSVFEDTPDDVWAMNELIKAYRDRELRVRSAAAQSLKKYGKEVEVTPPESTGATRQAASVQNLPPSVMYSLEEMMEDKQGPEKVTYPPLRRNKQIPQSILDANYDFQKLDAASKSKEVTVREAAAWALGVMADPRGVVILVQILHDPETVVRESAARSLGQIRYRNDTKKPASRFEDMTEDRKAADALLRALKDKEITVRAATAAALSNYGKPEVMKTLLGLLDDTSSTIRAAAATGLGGCPYLEVIPALIRMLRDDDFFTRLCSARSLGKLGDAQALDPLMELLHDPNASVRLNTARALVDLGIKGVGTNQFWFRAVDQLIALGSMDSSEEVQTFAQEAVVKLQVRLTHSS
jgi:HEAT repeat protein